MRQRTFHDLIFLVCWLSSASRLGLEQSRPPRVSCLFHFTGCGLCLVSFVVRPGVSWNSVGAGGFDCQIVHASKKPEKAEFAPILAPGVSANPVFGPVLNAPSNNGDLVVECRCAGLILENASSVVSEFLGAVECTSDWSSIKYFLFHRFFSDNFSVASNAVDLGVLPGPAAFAGGAVPADGLAIANLPFALPAGFVDCASLIGDVLLLDPSVGSFG